MKKTIIIFFISAFVLTLTSCKKDVLNKVPLDIISDNNVWSDPVLVDAYLTQVYAQVYILTNENNDNPWPEGESGVGPMEVNEVSDECRANWVGNAFTYKFGNLKIGGGLLEWWEQSYSAIRSLNVFIQRVPAAPVDDAFRKERTAEARFLRAYNYFSMVKRYGGVPIITQPQAIDAPKDSLYPKRATEKAVYDFVISEIDAFANDLPVTNTSADYGRPTKYAALALKCRAALYAGSIAQFGTVKLNGVVGIAASEAPAYYQVAYDAAKTIMNSGNYTLYNKNADKAMNFRNIFLDKNNSEVIFARKHAFTSIQAGGNGWAYDFFQCPVPNAWGAGNQDGPYLEMIEEFEHIDGTSGKLDRTNIQQGLWTTDQLWANKDPRFFATIYTQNTKWKGGLIDFHYGIVRSDGTIQTDGSYNGVLAKGNQLWVGVGFGVMKYLDESKDNFGDISSSGTDWIGFRYGEILLNYAEAAFELSKTNEALDAINQIRSRAGIALLSVIDRDKIRHERKVELAFEGHRYWDVRRWRTAVADLSKNNSGLRYILDFATGKYQLQVIDNTDGTVAVPAFYERNYYFPITLARTGNNPNLLENPGYE
jgi:hypothetical protein